MNEFACSLAAALALATGGSAPVREHPMETVMQDDAQLLFRAPALVRRDARRMASLGVDRVRITASWSSLAPGTESPQRPEFDAADSRAYPRAPFERLDRAVREVHAAGMEAMIDVAFFAPRWAVERPGTREGRHVWKPSVGEFGLFARAVSDRYSGKFADPESDSGAPLPAVRLWTTWNEPNHGAFLQPQWETSGSRRVPSSPHHYRAMHNAAYDQIKAVNPANRVLIGGLASFGVPGRNASSNLGPLRFTRELACVDSKLRPLDRPECRDFRPLRADGFAHHPYSLNTAPDARDETKDRVQIGEIDRLTSLLAELDAAGRLEAPLPLYLTEYGYETNPPDPAGHPPAEHARYLGEATALAWRNPAVRMFPQFLLQDLGPDLSQPASSPRRWSDYQSGLYDPDGAPKTEVIQGFKLPFYAEAGGAPDGAGAVAVFGQVRPGEGPQHVTVERLDPVRGWVTNEDGCASLTTDRQGFYTRRFTYRARATTYRAVWRGPDGTLEASPEVTVGIPRLAKNVAPPGAGA